MSDSGRADALLADLPRNGRGRLKVFLGAAPGVGKTYAMLQAAHTQLRQGVKLVAGVVETHGRAETEALLAGLPQQPLLRSEYRGVMLEEMDLDGLLAAKPKLVLVDELATATRPAAAMKSAGKIFRNCSLRASTCLPRSTFSTWKASTTKCAGSPACRCVKRCRTGYCKKPTNCC
jgi:hypothetical protein